MVDLPRRFYVRSAAAAGGGAPQLAVTSRAARQMCSGSQQPELAKRSAVAVASVAYFPVKERSAPRGHRRHASCWAAGRSRALAGKR